MTTIIHIQGEIIASNQSILSTERWEHDTVSLSDSMVNKSTTNGTIGPSKSISQIDVLSGQQNETDEI